MKCSWIIQVPSGNPEPDSEADCWQFVECGAPLTVTHHNPADTSGWSDGYRCDNGHNHLPLEMELAPGGPAWVREMRECWGD